MRMQQLTCAVLCLFVVEKSFAQDSLSYTDKLLHFPDKLFTAVEHKTSVIETKLIHQTGKYLKRLARQEQKLKKKVSSIDSSAAKEIFGDGINNYNELQDKFKNSTARLDKFNNVYSGHLDSLTTALNFLKENKLIGGSAELQGRLTETLNKLNGWQGKLNQAEEIKKYLQQRQQYLQQQLQKFGLTKQFQKFRREIFYYKAQVDEYKQIFENPSKLEEKLMGLLSESKLFRDFFNKHSGLAAIFRLPGNDPSNSVAIIPGLQTRNMLLQDLQARIGSGPDVQQMVQQNIGDAQAQLSQLKEKLNQLGSGGGDIDMPDYKKLNPYRVKSFFKRIELNGNIQSVKSNLLYPVTTDFAFGAGYRINDKSIAGLSFSQKIGWGKNLRNISVTYEGIGLRSFIDIRVNKAGFWASGGAEANYRSRFNDLSIFKDFSPWSKSALLGIKKTYKAGKLNGNVSLLYDFLYRQSQPPGQALLFRLGYSFK